MAMLAVNFIICISNVPSLLHVILQDGTYSGELHLTGDDGNFNCWNEVQDTYSTF
jgi:hypothetical protein